METEDDASLPSQENGESASNVDKNGSTTAYEQQVVEANDSTENSDQNVVNETVRSIVEGDGNVDANVSEVHVVKVIGEVNEPRGSIEVDKSVDTNGREENVGSASVENGACGSLGDESQDQTNRVILELSLQNEYLKAQIQEIKSEFARPSVVSAARESESLVPEEVKSLREQIVSLEKAIQEQKETQKAAENALEHLRMEYAEADGKVQDLSAKLIQAQQKLEQEIKERDEKYVELDSKFGRLHKRAKQRIQEIQKEKDDMESRFNDINAKLEEATSQKAQAQQELDRSRQQASEALRSMDVERQQLRTANNKLRDNLDEMHRALEAKNNDLEGLQQSLFEKEQALQQARISLQALEEKRHASFAELSSKHQKQLESLEAQLNDAVAERNKAAETISSLQTLVAQKDSKIAELDAASTGESARLGAAMEELRGELNHLKSEHDKEKQTWETAYQALRTKLEASETACLRSEIELSKTRSQLELEISTRSQLSTAKEAELLTVKTELSRLEGEFTSYKVRAHAILQKKEAELAAKNSELLKAQEEAVKEVEKELVAALAERDKAVEDLQVALGVHDRELETRDAALHDAEQRIKSLTIKLDSITSRYMSEKETWQKELENTEENWRSKYATLESQKNKSTEVENGNGAQMQLKEIKMQYEKLKEEHDAFRDIADRTIEEKEKEIRKLIELNKSLEQSIESESRQKMDHSEDRSTVGFSVSQKQDFDTFSIEAAEQQILLLARQQAQREEQLAQSQRHILALQEEIEELERENRLHSQQVSMLKEEIRNADRSEKREGIDMTYLKNVILKLLETGEVEALLPVVATLLQFSPEEFRKCQQAYQS